MLKSLCRSTPPNTRRPNVAAVGGSIRRGPYLPIQRRSAAVHPVEGGRDRPKEGEGDAGVSALLQSEGWRWKTYDANQQELSEVVRRLATVVANIHFLRRLPSFPTRRRIAAAAATMIVGRS